MLTFAPSHLSEAGTKVSFDSSSSLLSPRPSVALSLFTAAREDVEDGTWEGHGAYQSLALQTCIFTSSTVQTLSNIPTLAC